MAKNVQGSVMHLEAQVQHVKYISRGGEKLAAALDAFPIPVQGATCADLGSHIGGFVDCLLQRGAQKVYSVDTSYGTLAWRLRRDPRVKVLERSNAMHVALPEPVDLVTIDVGWTPQARILPNVHRLIHQNTGHVVSLIKPHYEAPRELLTDGVLREEEVAAILHQVQEQIREAHFDIRAMIESPLRGHGGNREFLAHLVPCGGFPSQSTGAR